MLQIALLGVRELGCIHLDKSHISLYDKNKMGAVRDE